MMRIEPLILTAMFIALIAFNPNSVEANGPCNPQIQTCL